jgi:hypothetical protein
MFIGLVDKQLGSLLDASMHWKEPFLYYSICTKVEDSVRVI